MNDKQQLAAMGAELRLTEEQAKGLAERMPQSGVFQIIDDQPLCMAKRIEELEAQVRALTTPEGWQLVPVVPTEEMCEAGANAPLKVRQSEKCWIGDIYASMLAAAPKPHPKP